MDLVGCEDAEEAGNDGKAGFVVGEKGAIKYHGECGKREGWYRHAVVQDLQEVCDAAWRVGEDEDWPALDGWRCVDGLDEFAEDVRVSGEKSLVYDKVIRGGEDDDVAVEKGEISVFNKVVGHEYPWEF